MIESVLSDTRPTALRKRLYRLALEQAHRSLCPLRNISSLT